MGWPCPPLAFLAVFFVWPVAAIIAARPAPRRAVGSLAPSATSSPTRSSAGWRGSRSGRPWSPPCSASWWPASRGRRCSPRYRFAGQAASSGPPCSSRSSCPPWWSVSPSSECSVPPGVTGVDLSGTLWAILIAHVFFNYAVVVRTVGGAWATLDPRVEDAARTLGALTVAGVREVTLPRLRPAIAAAASIVFLFTFTSFGIVLILGGIPPTHARGRDLRPDRPLPAPRCGCRSGPVQLVAVIAVLAWFGRTQHRRPSCSAPVRPPGGPSGRCGPVRTRLVRRGQPRVHGAAARHSARGARRSLVRRIRRMGPRQLPGARLGPARLDLVRARRSTPSSTPCCSPPAPRSRPGARRLRGVGHRRHRRALSGGPGLLAGPAGPTLP